MMLKLNGMGKKVIIFTIVLVGVLVGLVCYWYWHKVAIRSISKEVNTSSLPALSASSNPADASDSSKGFYLKDITDIHYADDTEGAYFYNDNAVYYGAPTDIAHPSSATHIVGASYDTFFVPFMKLKAFHYAKDAQHVYFDGKVVLGADPQSFGTFFLDNPDSLRYEYGRDNKNFYRDEKVITDSELISDLGEVLLYNLTLDVGGSSSWGSRTTGNMTVTFSKYDPDEPHIVVADLRGNTHDVALSLKSPLYRFPVEEGVFTIRFCGVRSGGVLFDGERIFLQITDDDSDPVCPNLEG